MTSPVGRLLQGVSDRHEERTLRHDLGQVLGTMSAVLGVIESDPLHTAAVIPRLEQLRGQAEWMSVMLLAENAAHPALTDVGDAVGEIWAAEGQHTLCTVRLVREPVPLAVVDPVVLRRAVRNLLSNAIRAAGHRGTVEIAVHRSAGHIVIEVSDDGPGFGQIPAQQGLGLLTVRRFAASCGGSLLVGTSALGGAKVWLQLPTEHERTYYLEGDSA